MDNRIIRQFRELGAARTVALGLAFALAVVGLEATVAHFAGRDLRSAAQLIPVGFAPLAVVGLMWVVLGRRSQRTLRFSVRAVALVAMSVGLIGSALHAAAWMRLLEGQELTFESVELALAVAPPLGAPGAFFGIGVMLWLIVSPRISVRIETIPEVALSVS